MNAGILAVNSFPGGNHLDERLPLKISFSMQPFRQNRELVSSQCSSNDTVRAYVCACTVCVN